MPSFVWPEMELQKRRLGSVVSHLSPEFSADVICDIGRYSRISNQNRRQGYDVCFWSKAFRDFEGCINPTPQLSDSEARQQATRIVEAQVRPGTAAPGTKFSVVVAVDENGKILGVNNPYNLPTALFQAGYAALRQWQFRPYIHNGKPDSFDAHITFVVR